MPGTSSTATQTIDQTTTGITLFYDQDADVAYCALSGGGGGSYTRNVPVPQMSGDVIFKLNQDGQIGGFTVLSASSHLPQSVLASAQPGNVSDWKT